MIDIRTQSVVDDANEVIVHHKTKFILQEYNDGALLSYANKTLAYIGDITNEFIPIEIYLEDLKADLGMFFGESIRVTKPAVHLIIDKILHTNTVCKMLWEQVTKEKENEK